MNSIGNHLPPITTAGDIPDDDSGDELLEMIEDIVQEVRYNVNRLGADAPIPMGKLGYNPSSPLKFRYFVMASFLEMRNERPRNFVIYTLERGNR